MTKGILLFVALTALVRSAVGQEVIGELRENTVQKYYRYKPAAVSHQTRASLPFVDDFSTSSVVPDQSKWIGCQAFVNNTYPVNPPTIGVATLDGLDCNGQPYDQTGSSQTPRSADTLASQPIDLSGHTPDDAVYLSFMYEPQGLGNYPNAGDSLALEFRVDSLHWNKVWSVPGFSASIAHPQFKSIIVQLSDPAYFNDHFQFRFRNKASITGNLDHWHIDYVKLDAGRNDADTVLNDIAIQYPSPSLLRNYREMPWKQFRANAAGETADQAQIYSRNNYTTDKNTTYGYDSHDIFTGAVLASPPVASFNFTLMSSDTLTLQPVDVGSLASNDSALIRTSYFTFLTGGTTDALPANDTVVQYQRFGNYFAYDDGTAEKMTYLQGLASQSALRFHVNVPDSLQGVYLQSARNNGPETSLLFSVKVWKSIQNNQLLYQRDFLHPVYVDSINGFTTFLFDSAIAVTDTFYVGWQQSQNAGMNFGLDMNSSTHGGYFINLGAGWQHSTLPGAVMLRPIVGSRNGVYNTGVAQSPKEPAWHAYPNPVTDWVKVTGAADNARFELINALGQTLAAGNVSHERVDLPTLAPGLYLLRVTSNDLSKTFRLVKQ